MSKLFYHIRVATNAKVRLQNSFGPQQAWYQDYYREHSTVQVKPQSAYPIGEKIEHQMAENAFMQEARADALEQMRKHGFNDVKMDDFEPSLIKTVRFSKVGDQEI